MVDKSKDYAAWVAVVQELDDAVEHLRALMDEMNEEGFGDVELRLGLGHVYAHLNRAWHQRDTTEQEQAAFTEEQFREWSRFPKDVDPV